MVSTENDSVIRTTRPWLLLVVLAGVQFLLVLDMTLVNVAIAPMSAELGLTGSELAWIVNAYTVVFGGLLLFGGRLADVVGHARMCWTGVALFGVSSGAAVLAPGAVVVILARAGQGAGAALISPAAIALVTVAFTEEIARRRAYAVWAAVASSGGAAGVLLSGLLSNYLGWRSIFLANLLVAMLCAVFLPLLVRFDRPGRPGKVDLTSAVTATASVGLVVYSLLGDSGWPGTATGKFVMVAIGIGVLLLFVLRQKRSVNPLMPLSFFASKIRIVTSAVGVILAGVSAFLYFSTGLFMQQVLGYSPLRAGLAYLPAFATMLVAMGLTGRLVQRFGLRLLVPMALAVTAAGPALLSRVDERSAYLSDIFPGLLLFGLGSAPLFVAVTIGVMHGAGPDVAGVAGGVLNSVQQVGGAIGLALLVSAASFRTRQLLSAGVTGSSAQTAGYHWGFAIAVFLLLATAVVAMLMLPSREPASEREENQETSCST